MKCSNMIRSVLFLAGFFGLMSDSGYGQSPEPSQSPVPTSITYQGRVAVNGVAYTGTGSFKFALVKGFDKDENGKFTRYESMWSNDGLSANGWEPTKAVEEIAIQGGQYSVALGDTTIGGGGMTERLPADVLAKVEVDDLRLRVWFNDGTNGFQQLSPDVPLGAVPYAQVAARVPDGAITGAMVARGTLSGDRLQDGAVTASKLAPGALTASRVDGSVLLSRISNEVTYLQSGYTLVGSLSIGTETFYAYEYSNQPFASLAVFKSDGAKLTDGQVEPIDFGWVKANPVESVLTVYNFGNQPLTDLSAVIDGAGAGGFAASFDDTSIPVGSSTLLRLTASAVSASVNSLASAYLHVSASGISNPMDLPLRKVNLLDPTLVQIPAGSFTMGRTSGDTESDAPPITVTVSAFSVQKTEVTKIEWDEVRAWALAVGYTDLREGAGKAPHHPVGSVTWWDVVKWCNARSQKEGLVPCYYVNSDVMKTGTVVPSVNWNASGYRLPTEAEWEKAARGGVSGKRYPWGLDTISHQNANYYSTGTGFGNQSGEAAYHPEFSILPEPFTSPGGRFAGNGFGLFDMSGNVWEWCWDWYASTGYSAANGATDPNGPVSGVRRVVRGGSWAENPYHDRCGSRSNSEPGDYSHSIGFRPVRKY